MRITPNLKTTFAALFIVSALATWTTSLVYGHELPYPLRFHSSTVRIDDRTASYATQISNAVDDFDDNTDMNWSDAEPAEIIYLEGNWGATGWIAGARPYTDGVVCATWPNLDLTGDCDDDENKADFAYIYLNTHYQEKLNEEIENAVRHEPGHVLGMGHTLCGADSVMEHGWCNNPPESLTSHDKDHINDWY